MKKYAIAAFLEDAPKGTTFPKTEWLLHLTILRPFFTDEDPAFLTKILEDSLAGIQKILLKGKVKELFGKDKDIAVTELERTTEIQNLHDRVKEFFSAVTNFDSEEFPDYRPHITKQGNREVEIGEEIVVNSVSLIKFEGSSREVLTTVNLQ